MQGGRPCWSGRGRPPFFYCATFEKLWARVPFSFLPLSVAVKKLLSAGAKTYEKRPFKKSRNGGAYRMIFLKSAAKRIECKALGVRARRGAFLHTRYRLCVFRENKKKALLAVMQRPKLAQRLAPKIGVKPMQHCDRPKSRYNRTANLIEPPQPPQTE